MVLLDIEDQDLEQRIKYYEKMESLKAIFLEQYIPEAVFEDVYFLENGKEISRIYIELPNVSIHNKNTWQEVMYFLNTNMLKFEEFWFEFEDFIKD